MLFWLPSVACQSAPVKAASYYLITNQQDGSQFFSASSTAVTYASNQGSNNLLFQFVRQTDGTFLIKSVSSGRCLSASTSGIAVATCPTSVTTKFKFQVTPEYTGTFATDNGVVYIRSVAVNQCVDTYNGAVATGTGIQWWPCDTSLPNQYFSLFSVNGYPSITGKSFQITFGQNTFLTLSNGVFSYQPLTGSASQIFTFTTQPGSTYSLRVNGNCVFASSSGLSAGACPTSFSAPYLFRILQTNAQVTIQSVGLNQCLDSYWDTSSGPANWWSCDVDGNPNQSFQLVAPVVTTTTTTTATPSPTPSTTPAAQCQVRKEVRELSVTERTSFLQALQCLKSSPSKIAGIGSPSRFDDISYVHYRVMNTAHNSPLFLAWHRAYLYTFEKILQQECGYQGTIPFWDWRVDSTSPTTSPVLDIYGGNGRATDTCVVTGPFANWRSTFASAQCLQRDYLNANQGLVSQSGGFSRESVQYIISTYKNYNDFSSNLEYGAHASVHIGVGGSMYYLTQSANDPLFYAHHTMIDFAWASWQSVNPTTGYQYNNANGAAVISSTQVMDLWGLKADGQPALVAKDMLNTTAGPLCYTYSSSVSSQVPANFVKRDDEIPDLKCREPLPEAFVLANNWPLHKIRQHEKDVCDFVSFCNKDGEFKTHKKRFRAMRAQYRQAHKEYEQKIDGIVKRYHKH